MEDLEYVALEEVTARYGSGYPDDPNIPLVKNLAYHNLQHSWRVRDAAAMLARINGLNEYDSRLARVIASAHDVIHESADDKSAEELSTVWLHDHLERQGINPIDKEITRLAILGTTPLLDTDGAFLGQQFILTQFPSQRAGEIALCVAAADMEAVFRPYGPAVAHDLYKEHIGLATHESPDSLDDVVDFQQKQIEFVATFRPLYPDLERIFGDLRKPIINHHESILDDIYRGNIYEWSQIVARDNEFSKSLR